MIIFWLAVKRSDAVENKEKDQYSALNYFMRDFSRYQNEQNIVLFTDKNTIFSVSEFKYLSRLSLKISISLYSRSNISEFLQVIIYIQNVDLNNFLLSARINPASCSSSQRIWTWCYLRSSITIKRLSLEKINIGLLSRHRKRNLRLQLENVIFQ